jgi:hypothetical protein
MTLSPLFSFIVPRPLLERTQEGVGEGQVLHYHIIALPVSMARPLRIKFPGALYHITSRGNDRADIYLGDEDRQAFLDVLGEVCQRMQWVCYAYCLITN